MAELKFFDLIEKANQALDASDIEQGVNLLREFPEQEAFQNYHWPRTPA